MNIQTALDEHKESWLALSKYGGQFLSRAASELISGLPLDERVGYQTRYWLVYSALTRQDIKAARQFILDWSNPNKRIGEMVSKFVPGEHYHTMNTKFDTLDEAIQYIKRNGRIYAGLKEVHVYSRDGD